MEILEFIGYVSAIIIGVSLGLIGGGGSILAVPSLAYLFFIDEKTATAYSLFIVGISSLLGGFKQHTKGYVDWKTAFIFGAPAILGVSIIRKFVIPILPDTLFVINHFPITRRMAMFGLFAILMITAGISMLLNKTVKPKSNTIQYNYPLILIEGILVGAVTGLIGAGGGFLIIPALVLLANVEIKTAIGTSLIIIAMKSLIGFFIGDAFLIEINWEFLLVFTTLSLIGIFIGSFLSNYINGQKLKKGFGYFIFIMALFIFYMEFFI